MSGEYCNPISRGIPKLWQGISINILDLAWRSVVLVKESGVAREKHILSYIAFFRVPMNTCRCIYGCEYQLKLNNEYYQNYV